MQNITFNFTELHQHGAAFFEYLALRKSHFVDELGWDVPHNSKVEMDQYDNPGAYYSLVLREGRVVAGARALATSAVWGEQFGERGQEGRFQMVHQLTAAPWSHRFTISHAAHSSLESTGTLRLRLPSIRSCSILCDCVQISQLDSDGIELRGPTELAFPNSDNGTSLMKKPIALAGR